MGYGGGFGEVKGSAPALPLNFCWDGGDLVFLALAWPAVPPVDFPFSLVLPVLPLAVCLQQSLIAALPVPG